MQDDRRISLTTGERINWLMARRGLKPGRLAATIGITEPTLWRYRSGRRLLPADVLAKLVRELQTSADFLLCLTDDPRPLPYSEGAPTARYLGRPDWGMGPRAAPLAVSASG